MATCIQGSEGTTTTTSSDYDRGYADGMAAAQAKIDGLERVADYWYFKANNPGVLTPGERVVASIADGMDAEEERRKRYARLDLIEAKKFSTARRLIADGMTSDVEVAKRSGLFAPTVANIRGGVL